MYFSSGGEAAVASHMAGKLTFTDGLLHLPHLSYIHQQHLFQNILNET